MMLSLHDRHHARPRQTWLHGGRQWSETRDIVSMHPEEIVRVRACNTTAAFRVVQLGDMRPMLRIRLGEIAAIDLDVDDLDVDGAEPFEIAVVGQPAASRHVRVRGASAG